MAALEKTPITDGPNIARIIIVRTQFGTLIRMTGNTQWKWCYRSLLSTLIFAIICISEFKFIEGLSGGYAIAFVSFFLTVTGVAVAALFFRLAQVMDSILNTHDP